MPDMIDWNVFFALLGFWGLGIFTALAFIRGAANRDWEE